MINFFKRKPQPKQQKQKVKQLSKDDFEWEVDTFLTKHPKAREIENRLAPLDAHVLHHPKEYVESFMNRINAYYELKEYCFNQGEIGKEYFKISWQECHNSQKPKFDFVDHLQDQLEDYENNYQQHLEKYNLTFEALQRAGHRKEDERDKDIYISKMLRIDDRSNIYMNNQDNYISNIGKKCVAYEKSLLDFAKCYQNSVCPNCGEIVELPKRKKACHKCKKTIHIVKGGIKQGNMALRDKEYSILKQIRDDFYVEREYNKNYHLRVDIKKMYN